MHMTMRILFLLLLVPAVCFSQNREFPTRQEMRQPAKADSAKDSTKTVLISYPKKPGKVNVNCDPRVKELADRYNSMEHVQKGFRVQIFLGSREGQAKARSKFRSLYSGYHTYPVYQAPNFKIRVGDFKDRVDAERLLMKVRQDFPGAYIVPDEVELSRLP